MSAFFPSPSKLLQRLCWYMQKGVYRRDDLLREAGRLIRERLSRRL